MSVIEYHDVISMDYDRKAINKRLASYEEDYEELMSSKTKREAYMRDLRKQQILKNRIRNFISMDHIRFDKKNFTTKWLPTFTEEDKDEEFYFVAIYLRPTDVVGFENIKKYRDYFQVTKIGVVFTSNQASNFAPITAVYIPPRIDESINKADCLQASKVATYCGKEKGFMTINLPECMMVKSVGEEKVKFPQIEPGLYCTKDDKCEYDYGAIVFYTQNKEQSINAELSWDIDFYAGVDYMNIESGSIPDGGDDDGDGDQDGDGIQDGDGDGDGDGDDGDGNGNGNGCAPKGVSVTKKTRVIRWTQNKKK